MLQVVSKSTALCFFAGRCALVAGLLVTLPAIAQAQPSAETQAGVQIGAQAALDGATPYEAPSFQAEIPLGDILREDGTIDLDTPFQGTLDLSGFSVTMEAGGTLRAVSEDGQWLPGEQAPGASNTIEALVWGSDGALYVGGWFTSAGGVSGTNYIARWTPDGSGAGGAWSALGSGVNSGVYALAWGPDGVLYAGGDFTSAGGVWGADRIARWTPDGTGGSWSALGSGVNSFVWALDWGPDGALYAGGNFTSAGGVSADRIARWTPDGSGEGGAWSALGSGVNDVVRALAWGPDGALYVGGEFTSAGGIPGTSRIARWTLDGTVGTWSALDSGVNQVVRTLAWGPDGALYAGGLFLSAGGVSGARGVARWTPDGTGGAWSALGSGLNSQVHALAWGPDGALYAGGSFTSAGGVSGAHHIARWTPDGTGAGGAWSELGSSVNHRVRALVWGPDGALYAGGEFISAGGVSVDRIARWTPDGTGTDGVWSALGLGVVRAIHALAWGPDGALYAGGDFTSGGGVSGANYIARWTPDGTGGAWSALGSGVGSIVRALAWGPDGALYVGGEFTSAGDVSASRIARWTPDRSGACGAWSALGVGVNGTVHALAWGPDDVLYVGGAFGSAGGVSGTKGIARWMPSDARDGSWSALDMGVGGRVFALAWGPDGALYAGGDFSSASGVSGTNYLARWTPDGTGPGGEWSALDSGVSWAVLALAWGPDGALYVGGHFSSAGGVSGTNYIARWTPDGTGGAWSALGEGADSGVLTLAWGPDGALYVGGHFGSVGGVYSNHIARWTPDGTGPDGAWSPLGSGLNGGVNALVWDPGNLLFVGGSFTQAGGLPSSRFARWHDGPVTTDPGSTPSPFVLEGNYPNPFSATTRLGFVLATPGPVRIEAFDLLGRSVAILLDDQAREAGRHEVFWDASALPAGVYVVRMTSGDFSQSRRVVVVQ